MSAAAARSEGDGPGAIRSLSGTIEALVPGVQFVDATLPRSRFACAAPEAIFTARPKLDPDERSFLRTFRQAGGHRELYLTESDRRPFRHVLAGIVESLERSRPVVVFLDRLDDADEVVELIDERVSLAAPWPRRPTKASGEILGRLLCDRGGIIAHPPGADPVLWIVPAHAINALSEALRAAGARPRRCAGAIRQSVSLAGFVLPGPADDQAGLALPADRFIHDGGYRSESDKGYTWIWTGPSPHFRLLLPETGRDRGRLVVSVIKTEDERNLEAMRLLVDGRAVAHRHMRWSGVDTAEIDLPARYGDMSVISLVCPHMTPDGGGQRLLGLCVSKVEVLP